MGRAATIRRGVATTLGLLVLAVAGVAGATSIIITGTGDTFVTAGPVGPGDYDVKWTSTRPAGYLGVGVFSGQFLYDPCGHDVFTDASGTVLIDETECTGFRPLPSTPFIAVGQTSAYGVIEVAPNSHFCDASGCLDENFSVFLQAQIPEPPDAQWIFSVTSAPEPATWTLMILGFGAAGLSLRRAGRTHSGQPRVRG